MKLLVLLTAALACASADSSAQVLRSDSEVNPDGFSYAYETSNGIAGSANGVVHNINSENAALAINGEYSYPGDDGKSYHLSYVADENGYQPQADFLPTPPPVPELIARALAYIAAHPQPEDKYPQPQNFPPPPAFPARAFPPPSRPFTSPAKLTPAIAAAILG